MYWHIWFGLWTRPVLLAIQNSMLTLFKEYLEKGTTFNLLFPVYSLRFSPLFSFCYFFLFWHSFSIDCCFLSPLLTHSHFFPCLFFPNPSCVCLCLSIYSCLPINTFSVHTWSLLSTVLDQNICSWGFISLWKSGSIWRRK